MLVHFAKDVEDWFRNGKINVFVAQMPQCLS